MAYITESFYNGGSYSLDFESQYGTNFTGYQNIHGHQLGFPGHPTSPNQLAETINAIKQGTKVFELSLLGIQGEKDQAIPKQHFKEIRALMHLSGVKPSVHGPLIDAAAFGQRGWLGEEERVQNERRMFDAVDKAFIVDPKRNIPVVFHTGNAGGYTRTYRAERDEKGREIEKLETVPVINLETNQVGAVEDTGQYTLDTTEEEFKAGAIDIKKGGSRMTHENAIRSQNSTYWRDKIKETILLKKDADEQLENSLVRAKGIGEGGINLLNIRIKSEEDKRKFNQALRIAEENWGVSTTFNKASILLENTDLAFDSVFNKAYTYGSEEQRRKLKELADKWKHEQEEYYRDVEKNGENPFSDAIFKKTMQDKYLSEIRDATRSRGKIVNGKRVIDENWGAPKISVDADKFAMEQAAKTFGGVAQRAYEKFGDKAPTIAIENIYEGLGWSRAEDHKKLIEKSRENFVAYLKNKKHMSESSAKKTADKLIGATWDVGHINIAKKKGFGDEYVVEATKKIAPMVKHVHLDDNFGFNDAHLAPGMGNVPMRKMLEQLEKHGKIKEMKMIVESGAFGADFRKPVHPFSLTAFGSGLSGYTTGPSWSEAVGGFGNYFGGYGTINPDQHHNLYGAGFTTLPRELGGQVGGGQSRFSGTPNA